MLTLTETTAGRDAAGTDWTTALSCFASSGQKLRHNGSMNVTSTGRRPTLSDTAPMIGLSGGHERATAVPMWRVDDIATAVERVRAAGGNATEPVQQPYGITSECTDDQGMRFYLGQH